MHEEPEQPGLVAWALDAAGVPYHTVNVIDHPDGLPSVDALGDCAGLVILGGPMGAADTDRYPGLAAEAELALAAIRADTPVLGICLGHQILGRALGGEFLPASTNEFGVLQLTRVAADPVLPGTGPLPGMLWHHDQVRLPAGAQLLVTGDEVPNQAFRYGSAIGVQFHMELELPLLDRWLAESPVAAGLSEHNRAQIRAEFAEHEAELHAVARPGLRAWAETCAA